MAAVLEEKAATPGTHVVVPNRLHRGDRLFKDDIDHPTWYLTLNGVLAKSSNIGTILATGQLGKTQPEANQVLYSYLRKFGIGSPTGLGYPGRDARHPRQAAGLVHLAAVHDPLRPGPLAQRHAGGLRLLDDRQRRRTHRAHPDPRHQGPRRPLHPGARPQEDPGGQRADRRGRSPPCWSRSSATRRAPAPRPASPATGSRARPARPTGSTRNWAATRATPPPSPGFAPADNPRITVYCAIQNPTKGSYFGGQICGPIYKKVMEFALKTLQVAPTGSDPARLPVTFKPGE